MIRLPAEQLGLFFKHLGGMKSDRKVDSALVKLFNEFFYWFSMSHSLARAREFAAIIDDSVKQRMINHARRNGENAEVMSQNIDNFVKMCNRGDKD